MSQRMGSKFGQHSEYNVSGKESKLKITIWTK